MKLSLYVCLIACISVLCLVTFINAQAGILASVNLDTLTMAAPNLFAGVFRFAQDYPIDDQQGGDNYLMNIYITKMIATNHKLRIIKDDNTTYLKYTIDNLKVHSRMDFVHNGDADIAQTTLHVNWDTATVSMNIKPNIINNAYDFVVDGIIVQGPDNAIFTPTDDWKQDIIDQAKPIFYKQVKPILIDNIQYAFDQNVKLFCGALFWDLKDRIPISTWGSIDYKLIDNSIVYDDKTNTLIVSHDGEIQTVKKETTQQKRTPIKMLSNNMAPYTIALSPFVFNSSYETFGKSRKLNHVYQQINPGPFSLYFNTDAFQQTLPALYTKYPHQELYYKSNIGQIPSVVLINGLASFTASPIITVCTLSTAGDDKEIELFTIQAKIGANLVMSLDHHNDDWVIVPHFDKLHVSVSAINSTIGPVNVGQIATLSNIIIAHLRDIITYDMIQPIPLPQIKGMRLYSPEFHYDDNNAIFMMANISYDWEL